MTERERDRIYVDSNVFIYAVEGDPGIAGPLLELFDSFRARPGVAVTSELTLGEVLAKADAAHRFHYLGLITSSKIFDLYPVSREILIETASYRLATGMPKLADAIHIVTAIRHGCRTILSADRRMKAPESISLLDTNAESVSRLIQELS